MMICQQCKREISDTAAFCAYCGAAVQRMAFCAACGAQLAPDAAFCPKCGSKVSQPDARPVPPPAAMPDLTTQIAQAEESCRVAEQQLTNQRGRETELAEAEQRNAAALKTLEERRTALTRQLDDLAKQREALAAEAADLDRQIDEAGRAAQALAEEEAAFTGGDGQTAMAQSAITLPDRLTQAEEPPVSKKKKRHSAASHKGKGISKRVVRWAVIAVAAVAAVFVLLAVLRELRYRGALQDMADGAYADAISTLEKLDDYRDSPAQLKLAWVGRGGQLLAEADYDGALDAYERAQDADGAAEGTHRVHYEKGKALLDAGDRKGAIAELQQAEDYQDAAALVRTNSYTLGVELLAQEDFSAAAEYLSLAGETEDAKVLCAYASGRAALEQKDYTSALTHFRAAGDYQDSAQRVLEACYLHAEELMVKGSYEEASRYYQSAGSYEDAASKSNQALFCAADTKAHGGKYDEAIALYQKLPGGYSYDGVTAGGQITMLQQAQKANGTKKATKNYIETRQVYTRTGSYDYWYRDSLQSGQYLELTATVNTDHTFTIEGKVCFLRWTDYSYVQQYLKEPVLTTRSFRIEDVTSIPSSYEIDDDLTLYYSGGTFSIKYYKSEHYSAGKDYRYTTKVTF